MPIVVNTANAPAAIGPYSQAIKAGGFLYTSGQLGLDPATGVLKEGFDAQCEQVFKNLVAVLDEAGTSLSKVVKVTVFITDLANFGVVNDTMVRLFKDHAPARSCVEVSALPKGGLVEVEMVALL